MLRALFSSLGEKILGTATLSFVFNIYFLTID
jgi:hypothetical protein